MKIKPVLNGLLFALLMMLASGDDTMVFGITPNDPMVYCQIGQEYSGVDLASNSLSEDVYGYDIDLLKFLAYRNRWDLTKWKVVCLDYDTLLQKLKNQEIIMGLGGIPITALRLSEGYEFSLPVYSSGLKIISKTLTKNDIWSFFDSFEPLLWIVILVTTLFTSIVTWILEDQNFQWKKNRVRMTTNLKEMIWQTFSGLFYQSEIRLQKFPARIVWLCFWFMILILTATYTADLTTKMSNSNLSLKFNSLEEAARTQATIVTLEPYKKTVSSYNIQNLIVKPWAQDSLKEIQESFLTNFDGAIIDAPAAYKINSKLPCSTYLFPDALVSFNYGYIFWKDVNNTMIQNVDSALLEIKESREYQSILNENIYVAPEDEACDNNIQKLTFSKLGGLWIIFAGSVVVAIIFDRVDACRRRKRGAKKDLTSKKVEEMNDDEKKFVLDSYLMINDYIHIPSSDLHLKLEEDIKTAFEHMEETLKSRFNTVEKKVLNTLNNNIGALGILDASTSEIQSRAENSIKRFEFSHDGKLKLD